MRRRVVVDPAASRALFDEAINRLRHSRLFNKNDWRITSAEYPDLIVDLPHPSGKRRLFRFRCDNWNEQAPSVKSVDASGRELDGQPTGDNFSQLQAGWGLCAAGTREYHVQHPENPWPLHQAKTTLGDIILTVASHYARANP